MSLKSTVKKEIEKARAEGKAWTDLRLFIKNSLEFVGGVFCRSSAHRGKRRSVAVSYSTHIGGRVVYCEKCLKRFAPKKDAVK